MEPSADSGRHLKPDPGTPFISAFIDEGGQVAVQRVADSFGMSKGQLAETVGLGRETFHKTARANATKAQTRLVEMIEIIGRVSVRAVLLRCRLRRHRGPSDPRRSGRASCKVGGRGLSLVQPAGARKGAAVVGHRPATL